MQQLFLSGMEVAALLDQVEARVSYLLEQRFPLHSTTEKSTPEVELLTVREAAQLLDVCQQTIHDWKRRGMLPYHKLGGRTYIKRADLLQALQGHQRTAKPARREVKRPVMRKLA